MADNRGRPLQPVRMVVLVVAVCLFVLHGPAAVLGQCLQGDCENGYGSYLFEDGRKYTGSWKQGELHGQGTMEFIDGNSYVGQWENNQPNGRGRLTYTATDSYEGEFRDGLRHGFGIYVTGDQTFRGQWKNDLPHGSGTILFDDGTTFSVLFRNGLRHGQGTYTDKDGKRYSGQWFEGTLLGDWTPIAPLAPVAAGSRFDGYGSIGRDRVILRSGPGTDHSRIRTLPQGYPLKILAQEGKWVSVTDAEGTKGWVHAPLVSPVHTVIVRVARANLRQGPGKEHPITGIGQAGDIFPVNGRQGKWLEIRRQEKLLWISSGLVWPADLEMD